MIFTLAKEAAQKASHQVGYRPDGTVLLALGGEASPVANPTSIHYHPLKSNDLDAVHRQLATLRERKLPIHGLSPAWLSRHGQSPVGLVDSLALFTGSLQDKDHWPHHLHHDLPLVASLTYGPGDDLYVLRKRLEVLCHAPRLTSVVLLPRHQGDRVMVADATTDGAQDVEFLAAARVALPPHVHVRASWAALGWKMAQASLCFGTDELAGWGIEEQLAYSGRGRPASVVEAAEIVAGIREARREPLEIVQCDWAS